MKVTERRNRILVLYVIVLSSLLAFASQVKAEEHAIDPNVPAQGESDTTVPQGQDQQSVALPQQFRQIPNQRELSPEEYAWLGRFVWNVMQQRANPQQAQLGEKEIHALVDDMRRNGDRMTLSFDELEALMNSEALCKGRAPEAFGLDVDRAAAAIKEIFSDK
jgi:hypothetical protein